MIHESYLNRLTEKGFWGGQTPTVVPTEDLSVLIRNELERLNITIEEYSRSASRYLNILPESVYRRLCDIFGGVTEGTDLAIADALLLTLNIHLHDTDLPVLPLSRKGASLLIDAYREDNPLTDEEYDKLCNQLFKLSISFVTAPLLLGDEDAIQRAKGRDRIQTLRRERSRRTAAASRKRKREKEAA